MTPSLARAAILLSLLWLCGCAGGPSARYFQPSAAQIGPEPNSYGQAVVPVHGLVVVQGDDLVYGVTRHPGRNRINAADVGQSRLTITQTLRHVIRNARVENRGYPGDTMAQSMERWADFPPGDLVILSYGFGDARAHTSPDGFSAELTAAVRHAHATGAAVFIVVPPNVGDPLRNAEIEPYRAIERTVGPAEGAEVFEAAASITRAKLAIQKGADQLPETYRAIGADLAPYIRVVGPDVGGAS